MSTRQSAKTHRGRTGVAMFAGILASMLLGSAVQAQNHQSEPESAPPERKLIEIYRIAPGKHEEFLRFIAELDEINIKAGLPPRDLYVHSDGAGWDFIIIQPASTPPDKADALSKAWDEAGAPSGANFFLKIREYIVEHSDTFATGPTSAGAYLSGVDDGE